MSEERMAILRMLSEGKISVDEAGKLLEVIGEGKEVPGHERRDSRDFGEFFEEIGAEVRRAVRSVNHVDLGQTVRREVDKAVKTVHEMDLGSVVNEVVDQVKVAVSEAVDGPSDREVAAAEAWTFAAGGMLALDAETSTGKITFRARDGGEVQVRAHTRVKALTREGAEALAEQVAVCADCEGETVRVWKVYPKLPHGVNVTINYEIEGPPHLDLDLCAVNGLVTASGSRGRINAQSTHGNLAIDGGQGPVQLRTQNGYIRAAIPELRHEGLFTNANGPIDIRLGAGAAPLTATSTNGHVDLRLPADFNGQLDARTINGQIQAAANLGAMRTVKRTLVEGPIGAGGAAQVRVCAHNGDVSVGRSDGEE